MNTVPYYAYKVKHVILSWVVAFFSKRVSLTQSGSYELRRGEFPGNIVAVRFAFDNRLMHLGDQLFHLGTMRALIQSGIDTAIVGPTPLAPLFDRLGIRVTTSTDVEKLPGVLIITKKELFWQTTRSFPQASALCLNYKSLGDLRIGDFIHSEVCRIFKEVKKDPIQPLSTDLWKLPTFPLHANTSFASKHTNCIIFNDFVASGFLGIAKQRKHLHNIAQEQKKEHMAHCVYVGSAKEACTSAPLFIDSDLRGKLSLMELIERIADSTVVAVISFDTFIAHLACLYGKNATIVPRRRTWKSWIKKHFFPMSVFAPETIVEINSL
ncbi:MAG TPA: hypothetical protein VG982_02985 [Candidatus Paceibacterota bacterium]|nr:hypothetical protein [Candidatus Paceibacterota bacterium]